jgi:hypothetical protein
MISGLTGRGGPFAYCDYWASVQGLRLILDPRIIRLGLIDLDLFRNALDRPAARLLSWRIYALAALLGPGAILYQVATRLRRSMGSREQKRWHRVLSSRLRPFRLELERVPDRHGLVTVQGLHGAWDGPLIDPSMLRCVASTLFPTYKVLLATLITMALLLTAWPILMRLNVGFIHGPIFIGVSFAALAAVLYLLFGDLWTALLGPLPILLARKLLVFSHGPEGFYLGLLGVVVIVYFVEFFFLPRPLPPVLYLYVNEPDHPLQTYRPEEAPTWLEGRAYWVWRFVILAPAEITKFWERDWERIEVWVRAEDGPRCGEIEWLVSDFHYRELWYEPARWVGEGAYTRLQSEVAAWRRAFKGRRHWLLELDLDLLFHTPSVRRIEFGLGPSPKPRSSLLRLLKSLGARIPRDFPPHYWSRIRDLELQGIVLLRDVPEHLRHASAWSILSKPWTYWRYPLGVLTPVQRFQYDAGGGPDVASRSSDFQIKSPDARKGDGRLAPDGRSVETAADPPPHGDGTV